MSRLCRHCSRPLEPRQQFFCSRRCSARAHLGNGNLRAESQPNNGKARRTVTVRMTSEQHAQLCDWADRSGMSVEAYCRASLFEGPEAIGTVAEPQVCMD